MENELIKGALFGAGIVGLAFGGIIVYLTIKLKEFQDESGDNLLKKIRAQAKMCNIDVHGEEYQVFISRMFMDIVGRKSSAAKAYSKMAFLKDNPEELMKRAKELQQQASIITAKNKPEAIEYDEEAIEVKPKKRRKKK